MNADQWAFRCPGLASLFPSGIPLAADGGLTFALRGRPGAGKTVLALHIAVSNCLLAGGHIAVFDLEQGTSLTGSLLDSLIHAWCQENAAADDLPSVRDRIHYIDARVMSKRALMADIQELAAEWDDRGDVDKSHSLFLIDSLNAVNDGTFERSEFDVGVRSEVVRKGFALMATCESGLGDGHDLPWLDYLADVVLDLGTNTSHSYSWRTVEVTKCRNAYHVRGVHPFIVRTTDKGKGLKLTVFPSLAAKLQSWRNELERQEDGGLSSSPAQVSLGIGDFDAMVGRVARRSSTAYVGTRACRKTPCALHFALPAESGDRTLVVSLGVDEAGVASVASDYRDLQCLLDPSRPGRFREDIVRFRYIWPGYITPPKLIAEIERLIDEHDICKAIVMDLCQISECFPLLHADGVFLAALVQLFRVKTVTSLFVDTVPRTAAIEGVLESHIATLADNVVEFRHLFFYGQEHLGVNVRRRHGFSSQARRGESFFELRTEEADGGKRIIEAKTALEGFVGLFSDAPRPSPITLFVFQSNTAQGLYNDRIEQLLEAAFPALRKDKDLKVHRMSPGDAAFHLRGLQFAIRAPQPDVRLAMLDQFWVGELSGQLSAVPAGMTPCKERYLDDVKGYGNAWPHYLNVGVLAALGDWSSPREGQFSFNNWQEVARDAHTLWDRHAQPVGWDYAPSHLFDFDKRSPESWSCMLLEVLGSAGLFEGGPNQPVEVKLSEPAALDQISAFLEVFWVGRTDRQRELHRLRDAYAAAPARFIETDVVQQGTRPLLLRCWYSDLASSASAVAANSTLGPVRLSHVPGGRGVRGEWYWGVIASGSSDVVGWKVVELLSGDEISGRKFDFGIGLPPEKAYYEPESGYASVDPSQTLAQVKAHIWDEAISRSRISHYPSISPILRRFLYEVLILDPAESDVRQRVESIAKAFDKRIRDVTSAPNRDPVPPAK